MSVPMSTLSSMSMSYNWDSSAIFDLIDMYRDRPVLWDMEREDYRDRSKRNAAWQEIAMHFGVDRLVVERKMKILVSQYRRELQRGLKGEASKWYAFARLSFLKAASNSNGSASGALPLNQSESEDEKYDDDETYDPKPRTKQHHANRTRSSTSPVMVAPQVQLQVQPMPSVSNVGNVITKPPTTEFVAPKLAPKRPQNLEPDETVTRKKTGCSSYGANKMLKMICREKRMRDEFAVYGEHIANKLRYIENLRARNTVQFHINNILYNAEMGKYDGPEGRTSREVRGEGNPRARLEEDDGVITESSGDSSRFIGVEIKQEPAPPY